MAYEVQTVTLKGTELLSAASAADRLILAGCAATQTFISQEDAINVSAVPESPYSTTTKVNVEGSENNHLFIYALFVAGESTGGDCKSLYIYGHKESDPTHDYVLAVLSSNTPFHLPIVGEVSNTYGTSLDLVYSVADGAVSSIDSSAFVTRAEFNRLYERAVTTHAYATPTVGEAQDVYGLKTFKNKVSIDYDSGANPNAYISMTRDNYSSELSGYSYQLNPTYGPSFNAVRGGLSFGTDDHKFETYVNETTNGSEITNAYRLLDEYGQNARTIANITAGAEYDYENGVRYQYGEASIEASESTGTNDAVILVRATKDVSEIIVNSDSMDFGVPVVNGSADGFEFNFNFTDGSSFIKINDPVLPSSAYDHSVGLHIINSTGNNNYAEIQSFVDDAYCESKTGIYSKFSTYYTTIEAASEEDESKIMLLSSYVRSDGTYFSRITLRQGDITLSCNYFNDLSKVGELKFDSGNSNVFYLMPSCPNGYKVNLGTSANKFGTVYSETYEGTTLNCVNIQCSGGISGNLSFNGNVSVNGDLNCTGKFNGNLNGLIPTKTTTSPVAPVGSIILVTLLKHSSMPTTLPCGTEISGNICQIKCCGIFNQSGLSIKEEGNVLPGMFKTLSYVEFDQNDLTVRQMALVIKISDV